MEFKNLIKLYIIRGLSVVFGVIFLFVGPLTCSAMAQSKNSAVNITGFVLGILGLAGGIALLAVGYAAKHLLFKDAYTERNYTKRESDVNFKYRGRRW